MSTLEQRIRSEQSVARITNEDLVCKDCVFKFDDENKMGNTSVCQMYESKPNKVLFGDECNFYQKN